MSESIETIRRLHAWSEGKPTLRGETVNVFIGDDDDILIVAFLRMGGESRPWGVAFGKPDEKPKILTVAEGRNRTRVGDMMVEFAPELLQHFRHPQHSDDPLSDWKTNSHRQIWLPGPTHVEMLHYIALSYARTRWDRDGVETLKALGNLANCLYIEQQRPGQQTVFTAANALRETYVFPASSVRQAHLGYLLGWLQGGRTRETRLAAARAAENISVATVLDPEFERKKIQPLIEEWGQANQDDNEKGRAGAEASVRRLLSPELLRRWELTRDSIAHLRSDKRQPNPGLLELVSLSRENLNRVWGENAMNDDEGGDAYWPGTLTEPNTRMAAGGFHEREGDDQKARHYLVHGDRELQREELAKGHGIIGTISAVSTEEPAWKIRYSYPELLTIREGKSLVIAGASDMQLTVIEIDNQTQTLIAKPNWTRTKKRFGKNGLPPEDRSWKGRELVFLEFQPLFIAGQLTNAAKRRSDDPNDVTNLIKSPRRKHAANDDDGPIISESAE